MSETAYTLASWYVKSGREEDFIAAWTGHLAEYFFSLPGSMWGTLIQSVEDPRQFYSFGPWESLEHVREMRADQRTADVFSTLGDMCEQMKPGVFWLVAQAERPS